MYSPRMNVCTQQCLPVQRESVLQARDTGPASLPPSHPPGGRETNSLVLPFGEMFPFQIKARLKRLGCAPVLFPEPVGRFQPGREARGGGCWGRAGDRDVPAGEDWQEFIGKGGRGGSSVEQGGADSPYQVRPLLCFSGKMQKDLASQDSRGFIRAQPTRSAHGETEQGRMFPS